MVQMDTIEKLQAFMDAYEYPVEAQTELVAAFTQAFSNAEYNQALTACVGEYEKDCKKGCWEALSLCKRISQEAKLNVYSLYLSVLILLADSSKKHYEEQGISKEIWKQNFTDLRYKLYECKLVKGVWGTFVPDWFIRFYDVSRFAFGKLQFETEKFGREYCKDGVTLQKDSVVVNVHIPRTGERLAPQDAEEAFNKADEFFKARYGLEKVAFVCHSWLLYPENLKLLKPTSNLHSFISRFDIIEWEEYNDYKEIWRLFDKDYTENLDELPADTSFRRAYLERMRKGEKTGCGFGVFIYK